MRSGRICVTKKAASYLPVPKELRRAGFDPRDQLRSELAGRPLSLYNALMPSTDFHVEAIDLLSNHVPCEAGIALVVAIYSRSQETDGPRGVGHPR